VLLPRNEHATTSATKTAASVYPILALIWGIASTDTLLLAEQGTGAICPPGIWERMIPLAQLITVALDALIITHIGRLRRNLDEKNASWRSLGPLFLISAGVLVFVASWAFFDRITFRWSVFLSSLSIGDLMLDSVAVVFLLVAGIYLLGSFHPALVALLVTTASVFTYIQMRILDGTLVRVWAGMWALGIAAVVFLGAGALFQMTPPASGSSHKSAERPIYKNRYGGYALLAFLLVVSQTILLRPNEAQHDAMSRVIAKSRTDSENWISGATQSQTLGEAAREYTARYKIPPPPNFDKWYEYARSVNSPIIDDFGQIHSDLLPYWGTLPSLIRQRTTHLLEHPSLSFGGLIIEGGKVEVSPHIHGTHRWMMDVMKTMVEPFAQWLPDMQLAFNLDDECRVSVPFDLLNRYKEEALESRARMASQVEFHGFSRVQDPPWPKDYLAEEKGEELWKRVSPWFQNWSKSPIFYEWISSTCPPKSPVHSYHWWNRKSACPSCSSPHMTDGVVSNWTLSGDLCHQPDLAYLHGFLESPSALAATHTLFPVFSQSRMHNFADILYPNPWNFGDKVVYEDGKGIPWHDKLNSLFWRGASSDGFAAHGAWQTFLRARFVHMAQRFNSAFGTSLLKSVSSTASASLDAPSARNKINGAVSVNVTFVGNFNRCDERDCAAEHTTFYGSASASPPPSTDFQEHWRHRHLMDLDGAAFSGRFLPFLKSASLPYRAALFRTWWEERVHPWRHFVPLDVRLTDLWRLVGYFGSVGDKEAERIAAEGSKWASEALRKEDMRVYMFRLLLEWGRIVDDRRGELGFVPR
jgi:hypothetical protein